MSASQKLCFCLYCFLLLFFSSSFQCRFSNLTKNVIFSPQHVLHEDFLFLFLFLMYHYDNLDSLLCGSFCWLRVYLYRNGLSTDNNKISYAEMMTDDVQTSRDERCFRLWINSLGIATYVNNLFEDVRNGWVFLF